MSWGSFRANIVNDDVLVCETGEGLHERFSAFASIISGELWLKAFTVDIRQNLQSCTGCQCNQKTKA